MGIAFSGWADPVSAIRDSNNVFSSLTGEKYISFGGGNANGIMTAAVLQSITNAIMGGLLNAYSGIAYDVEEGDTGLASAFAESFAAAKAAGFKVLVTVSHSAPYGIDDAAQLMDSFFTNGNIDFISPQLYTSGTETGNDFALSGGVAWGRYASSQAAIVPSIVRAAYYDNAVSTFAQYGVSIEGFVQWALIG
jgi:hypothetical protein